MRQEQGDGRTGAESLGDRRAIFEAFLKKQSQFPQRQDECKLIVDKELGRQIGFGWPEKQSRFNIRSQKTEDRRQKPRDTRLGAGRRGAIFLRLLCKTNPI
ncbi:MAG: hypothetical protein JSU70_09875 [Phycisphaerales bacterium]|nr:MAG: hypothetical protein JSU70_09875 [Phycisphaerales bacterium]